MSTLKTDLLAEMTEEPREHYRLTLDRAEFDRMKKQAMRRLLLRLFIGLALLPLALLMSSRSIQNKLLIGFVVGIFLFFAALLTASLYRTHKGWEGTRQRVLSTTYDYTVYSDCLIVHACSADRTCGVRLRHDELKLLRAKDTPPCLVIDGRLFPLRESELCEDSIFLQTKGKTM